MLLPAVLRHSRYVSPFGKNTKSREIGKRHILAPPEKNTKVKLGKPISTPRIEYSAEMIIYHVKKKAKKSLNSLIPGSSQNKNHYVLLGSSTYVVFYPRWALRVKVEGAEGSLMELIEEDSLQLAPAEKLCWPRSTHSGDDISKAIKGDDSRQAGSDWQG